MLCVLIAALVIVSLPWSFVVRGQSWTLLLEVGNVSWFRGGKADDPLLFNEVDEVAQKVFADLELLKTQKPVSIKSRLKFAWLELYFDLFQKFIFLLLFAYCFVRVGYFNRMLHRNRLLPFGKVYIALLFSSVGIFLSFFDLVRYGASAWGFRRIERGS